MEERKNEINTTQYNITQLKKLKKDHILHYYELNLTFICTSLFYI